MIAQSGIHSLLERVEVSPVDPGHFMWIDEFAMRVRILHKGVLIADTINPMRVTEFASRFLQPVLYLPPQSLLVPLRPTDETSQCPLKGTASHWSQPVGESAQSDRVTIGWSYDAPIAAAKQLTGRIAFFADRVTTVISAAV